MTRLWLTRWEWSCCGEPFAVSDRVDFGVAHRGADGWLTDTVGPDIARTVDAIESHHEEEFADRVRGRVTAIHIVTQRLTERRERRRPGHGAPPDAIAPGPGEEWPETRFDLGGGFSAGSRPSRDITVSTPLPGSARLSPRTTVPRDDAASPDEDVNALHTDRVSSPGWVVDVDEA